MMLLFFATLGARADPTVAFANGAPTFAFIAVQLATHFAFVFLVAGKLLAKWPACRSGPPSRPRTPRGRARDRRRGGGGAWMARGGAAGGAGGHGGVRRGDAVGAGGGGGAESHVMHFFCTIRA